MKSEQLIELAGAVALGQAPAETLRQALEQHQVEMEEFGDRFFAEVDSQGDDFSRRLASELHEVEQALGQYHAGLDELRGGQGTEALAQAAQDLRGALDDYQRAYLACGPSQSGLVNTLDNLWAARQAGRITAEEWLQACRQPGRLYVSALRELDESPHRQAPGIVERRQALLESMECLRQLEAGCTPDLLSRLAASQLDLESALDEYHRHAFGSHPTALTAVNWVIHAAEGVVRGHYSQGLLSTLAQDLAHKVEDSLEACRASGWGDESQGLHLQEALQELSQALRQLEGAPAPEALEQLQAGARLFQEASSALRQQASHSCPHCQARNLPLERLCQHCGGPLHSTFEWLAEAAPEGPSLATVLDGFSAWQAGRIVEEEFLACFDELEQSLRAAATRLTALQPPALPAQASLEDLETAREFIAVAQECLELSSQGVDECLRALDQMRRHGCAGRPEGFREGQALYSHGLSKLLQVQQVDRILTDYLKPLR